ncbi:DUF885 domain-containing protein [Flavihumibacter solisilvae]|uniref:DUF885 domain-containing protein n=1 Tax=Flavihumibacter solisilvae TaxID=1349421 RepID=A0A0C1LDZ9_9BACT|nr:DUF885 domain-containing protein [Flavihumibacter solisilvae]KIC93678.1 hypothetical protein OI18_16095 [Flavihumibacter solisilvae]
MKRIPARILTVITFMITSLGLTAQEGFNSPALKSLVARMEAFDRRENESDSFPLGRYAEEDFKRRYAFSKSTLADLQNIDTAKLDFNDYISWELLRFSLEDEVKEYEMKRYLNTVLSDYGFHIGFAGFANTPINNASTAEKYLRRLEAFPVYVRQQIALLRKGLSIGLSQPDFIIRGFAASYDKHIVSDAEQSIFIHPFDQRPSSVDNVRWNAYRKRCLQLIDNNIVPQYRIIKAFFEQEYIPKTRKSIGASEYPDGRAYYQQRVNFYTTSTVSYEEVYETGLKEVDRIKAEMEKVKTATGFRGSLQEFIGFLRTDKQFYVTTPEALLKEASFIAKKIDGLLPAYFGKLPRQPYAVQPVPAHLAPNYTAGRYSGAPVNSTRSGEYWVNTVNLPSRPLYNLEALTLHEAVPGHHLQISLTQELDSIPAFRRNFYVNAFGEGWALYCEYLGREMGLYQSPYSRFGQLTYEMWRACRLVIDVGIHAKGWTRQQAVDYLSSNTALSLHECNTEIDRYISWPGQALSYKIGELTIRRLREKTEKALGNRFNIRSFHDMILSRGTVTMKLLEQMTDRYISEQLTHTASISQ